MGPVTRGSEASGVGSAQGRLFQKMRALWEGAPQLPTLPNDSPSDSGETLIKEGAAIFSSASLEASFLD